MKQFILDSPDKMPLLGAWLRSYGFAKPLKVTVAENKSKRSEEQSAKFHAICGDVAKQREWMGKKLHKDQWKVLFVSGHSIATGAGAEVVPGLEGEFVNIRESTAGMSTSRLSSLLEYTLAWCAGNDVRLSEHGGDYAN